MIGTDLLCDPDRVLDPGLMARVLVARVDTQWQAFVAAKKREELECLIGEENLNPEATRRFIDNAFRDGGLATTGTAVTRILPPVSRFSKNNEHAARKQAVLARLAIFFERYFGLG